MEADKYKGHLRFSDTGGLSSEDVFVRAEDYDALAARVKKLEQKLKNYEPVNTYNGLTIEQWKERAEQAEAQLIARLVEALEKLQAMQIVEQMDIIEDSLLAAREVMNGG